MWCTTGTCFMVKPCLELWPFSWLIHYIVPCKNIHSPSFVVFKSTRFFILHQNGDVKLNLFVALPAESLFSLAHRATGISAHPSWVLPLHGNLSVIPQILSQIEVWALTGPFQHVYCTTAAVLLFQKLSHHRLNAGNEENSIVYLNIERFEIWLPVFHYQLTSWLF